MSEVVILGLGMTPVGEHWDRSLRSLAVEAVQRAREDAGGLKPEAVYIGNSLASMISHQSNLGALLTDHAALRGLEATTVEAAGASGGAAARLAYLAVQSGMVDVAMALGVEKITDQVGAAVEGALAQTLDGDYETVHGLTPAAQAALLMQRYLHCYEAPREAFAAFALTGHQNAVSNPNAMYRKAISVEAYAKADMVSDPLNLYDAAPLADGAAALIFARSDRLPQHLAQPLVRVTGSSVAIDTLALHDRPDPLGFQAAQVSMERACRQAGMLPQDADFFELMDSFSIYGILALEAAGFARRGEGWRLPADGQIGLAGKLPVSTFGGAKARGNPLGATGVYQLAEAALQLRGAAGANQVPGARRGLVQSLGGPASTVVTHVLEAWDGANSR